MAIKLLNMASNVHYQFRATGSSPGGAFQQLGGLRRLWLISREAGLQPQQIWEDEVLTAQTPRCPAETERAPDRYPVSLQLHYRVKSKLRPVEGFGQTIMMSSQDIVFAPGEGLEPGMNAEIVVDWPPFLDDRHLQLVLQVTITGSQDGEAEARIRTYGFRTRGRS